MFSLLKNHCFSVRCVNFMPDNVQYACKSFNMDCKEVGEFANNTWSSAYNIKNNFTWSKSKKFIKIGIYMFDDVIDEHHEN